MKVEFITDGLNTLKEDRSSLAAIFNDQNKVVGYVYIAYKKEQVVVINQFEIFEEEQNKGYEVEALKELIKIVRDDHYRYIFYKLEIYDNKMNHILSDLGFETVGKKYYQTDSKYLIRVFTVDKTANTIEKTIIATQIFPKMFKDQ